MNWEKAKLTDEEMAKTQEKYGEKDACSVIVKGFGACTGCSGACWVIRDAQLAKIKAMVEVEKPVVKLPKISDKQITVELYKVNTWDEEPFAGYTKQLGIDDQDVVNITRFGMILQREIDQSALTKQGFKVEK